MEVEFAKKIERREMVKGFFYYTVSFFLLLVSLACLIFMIMTFWIFIQNVAFINKNMSDLYTNVFLSCNMNSSDNKEPEHENSSSDIELDHNRLVEMIEYVQIIENVYKNARTFDIMSFFYMLISTILISLVAYYYNKMNMVIQSNKDLAMKLEMQIKENIGSIQDTIKKHNGIVLLYDITNIASEASNFLFTLETMCMQNSKDADTRINDYFPRLRNNLKKSVKLLKELSLSPEKKENLSIDQIDFISILFYSFPEKINTIALLRPDIINQETVEELLSYVNECKNIMDKLRKVCIK